MERYLQGLYLTLTENIGLTPALARKLTGMANDFIAENGFDDWVRTYNPNTEEGAAGFVEEAVRVLNSNVKTRYYVMDDPFARDYFLAKKPKATKSASALPAPQSGLPNLPAPPSGPPSPPPEGAEDGAGPAVLAEYARRLALDEPAQAEAERAYERREAEIAEAEARGDAVPAPLPAPPKAKKAKAKKAKTAKKDDDEDALAEAQRLADAEKEELARRDRARAEAESEALNEDAYALARLRMRASAGDADAQRELDARMEEQMRLQQEQEDYWNARHTHQYRLGESKKARQKKG